MHERQDLGEARGKSETEKARQNLESEVLVRLNGLSEMSGLRPRSRDGRKSRTVTTSWTVLVVETISQELGKALGQLYVNPEIIMFQLPPLDKCGASTQVAPTASGFVSVQ